jgi:hypothetical protein
MKLVKKCKFLMLALAAAMLLQLPALALRTDTMPFPDISRDAWYYDDIALLYKFEIMDGDTDGLFHPDDQLTRAQFIKMLATFEGLYTATKSTGVSWAEDAWNTLNEAGVLGSQVNEHGVKETTYIPLDRTELNKPITRYEMAFLVTNMLYVVFAENTVTINDPEKNIADFDSLDPTYRNAVEQAYGKGIIVGRTDGSFDGSSTLKRCEAAAVIVRLLWSSERVKVDFAEENEPVTPVDPNFTSFAIQYRSMSVEQRRVALFGNANKTYFTSASDASGYIVDVTIPIWRLQNGVKVASTATIQVHKLVAEEVKLIFQEIFDDPEQFPIKSIGGARYSDALRHAWGCAIDINPEENYYLQYSTGYQVGYYWKPYVDPYSITPDGSVVRAFAKYGWGWGGQGWSSGVDYMHFSILSSGG